MASILHGAPDERETLRRPPHGEQPESLDHEARNVQEESRMVLPGIQALFGFQLIAVFNEPFFRLPAALQHVHLIAIMAVACAIALIMAPAAYHRLAERGTVSRQWANFASGMMAAAMVPFAFAMAADLSIIASVITGSALAGAGIFVAAMLTFLGLWFALPLAGRSRNGGG